MYAICKDVGTNKHLTAGKEYEVLKIDPEGLFGRSFYIKNDQGYELFCLERECEHLDCKDWELVDEGV